MSARPAWQSRPVNDTCSFGLRKTFTSSENFGKLRNLWVKFSEKLEAVLPDPEPQAGVRDGATDDSELIQGRGSPAPIKGAQVHGSL